MAYDKGLEQRLHEHFQDRFDVEVKEMFGGLCFLLSSHMCCAIIGDTLMARVGPENYTDCLGKRFAREMDFTGKSMKGMVYVSPAGLESDAELKAWLDICEGFVMSLPPKKAKKKRNV